MLGDLGPIPAGIAPDWIICGGESGPRARPMHPAWPRSLRDQCQALGIPFLFKQWGEHLPVPILPDAGFAGGRAIELPQGGRAAVVMRVKTGPTMRGAVMAPMGPGDRNGLGEVLDAGIFAVRVGKRSAGRELDGHTHDEFPG